MSEPKHTRGNWIVLPEEPDKPYIRIRGSHMGARYKIANILCPVPLRENEREAEETRANARLFAASKDLLEALRRMVGAFDATGRSLVRKDGKPTSRDLAVAAIAKAEGRAA